MNNCQHTPITCQPPLLPPFLPCPTSLTCSTSILPPFPYLPPSLPHHPPPPQPPPPLLSSSVVDEVLAREQARKLKARQIRGARSHPHIHTLITHSHAYTLSHTTATPSHFPLPSLLSYTHSLCNATSSEPCIKAFLIPVE